MFENINAFLKQSSQTQEIFKYVSNEKGYKFIKGPLAGKFIDELLKENKNELIFYLEELYKDKHTNIHTKIVLKDIVNIYEIKKDL